MKIFKLIGFDNYIIKDKIMYRKAHKIKDFRCKFRYISDLKIKRSFKNNQIGYYLVKNNTRKFHSLKKLKHRLVLIKN